MCGVRRGVDVRGDDEVCSEVCDNWVVLCED